MMLEVSFIHPKVYVVVWKVNVGRTTLYLLDTDIKQNDPWDRELSYRLYTTNVIQRLRQQIILGFDCTGSKFKGRIAFIENYGEFMAKRLVRGVDVWLNNPRILLEASGASGSGK